MIEYKIISESSWGYTQIRKKMEKAINEYAKMGWRVISTSFGPYYGFATLERNANIND